MICAAALLLALPTYAHAQCTMPDDGLLHHWKMDEASGGTAVADSVGGVNGTWGGSGTIVSVPGVVGTAFSFAEDDNFIELGTPAALENVYPVTFSAWIYPLSINGGPYSVYNVIYSTDQDAAPGGGWGVFLDASGHLRKGQDGAGGDVTTNETVPLNEWTFVTVTLDPPGAARIYINGKEATYSLQQSLVWSDDTGTTKRIGSANGQTNWNMHGYMDDARLYGRILSDDEIDALYTTRSTADVNAGFMYYDTKHSRMAYCDGTNWVHAGIGSYNPNAVHFDGTNDWLGIAGNLSGIEDSDTFMYSFWIRPTASGCSFCRVFSLNDDSGAGGLFERVILVIDDTDDNGVYDAEFYTNKDQSGGTYSGPVAGSNEVMNVGEWYHVMVSNPGPSSLMQIYINDADEMAWSANDNLTVDFASDFTPSTAADDPIVSIGALYGGGSQIINADLADMWFSHDTGLDLSVPANRRKFISANGLPMYLGEDGSIPSGSQPDLFLTGDTANWHTNKGTGGGFTENGAITYSSSQPADNIIPHGADISSDLVGYWKLDEASTGLVIDSAGSNNGTMAGGLDAANDSVPGILGTALSFDGDDDYINFGDILGATTNYSVAAWVYLRSNRPVESNYAAVMKNGNFFLFHNDPAGPICGMEFSGGWTDYSFGLTDSFFEDSWHHVAMTYDGANVNLYVDGALEQTYAETGTPLGNSEDFVIGTNISWLSDRNFDGSIDDVRFYDRALSAADIELLYNISAPAGTIKYDPAFNVMTYSNGTEWVAMGPVGGTPPTSGLVGHWKLDETTGTTAVDSSGSGLDGAMVGGLSGSDSVTGQIDSGLDLDGNDDYVQIPDDPNLDITGAVTLSAWVQYQSDMGGIVIKQDAYDATSTNYGIYLDPTPPYVYSFALGDGTGYQYAESGVEPIVGIWQHIVGIADGTNVTMYIDGEQVSQTSQSRTLTANNTDLFIGTWDAGEPNYTLNAAIDDVRVYNRALSAAEVSQLYHFGVSGGLGDVNNACSNAGSITGSTAEGKMFYNADNNVMQYCNGERWIGIGQ